IGFTVIGVPSGVAIGALAGLCRLVPYLDIFVGLLLCTIVILTQGSGLGIFIAAIIVIGVVQALDGAIVTPRIIGDRAGLHPVAVIASVYAFGSQFGLLGVLLAVPVVAATVVILKLSWPFLSQSYFFRNID
ncbi:MAG: AI-2E family transporter, partial [Proteobacteria bacterium]